MTMTLAELTRQTARLVTRTVIGTTTSAPSNAIHVIDNVNLTTFPDDEFNNGTVWLTSGDNAGRSRAISDYVSASNRIVCAAFPNNIASGVTYEVATSDFVQYRDLRQAANLALREIGRIRDYDDTLTIVDDQLLYDLPAGISNVKRVWVLEDPGETDENPLINNHWKEEDGDLKFTKGYEPSTLYGTKIRIEYEKFHTELTGDTDTVDTQIDEQYLVHLSARQAMRLAYKRFGKAGDQTIPEWLNEAIEEMKKHHRRNRDTALIRERTA